jgi:hypothetical protein
VCKLTLVISCFYSHKISHHFCSDEVVVEKKSQPNASKKEEKVEKEEEAIAGPLTVFFGSQTGKFGLCMYVGHDGIVYFLLFCFTLHQFVIYVLIYPSFVSGTAEGFAEQIKQEGERHGNYTINLRFAIIEIMSCV